MTTLAALSRSAMRRRTHEEMKLERAARFARNVYGQKQPTPQFPAVPGFIYEPPSYVQSMRAARLARHPDANFLLLDKRCFFTGVMADDVRVGHENIDPRLRPWIGTRDHLVPMRRNVPGEPSEIADKAHTTTVWSCHVANVTLGLAPLLVRLTMRRWLMTIPFDREDRSVENGNRLRWTIINLMDEFRLEGRFPWSRKEGVSAAWWNPAISEPFMQRMWEAERHFISLDHRSRERFIDTLSWRF